jgi:hypothetical protein
MSNTQSSADESAPGLTPVVTVEFLVVWHVAAGAIQSGRQNHQPLINVA